MNEQTDFPQAHAQSSPSPDESQHRKIGGARGLAGMLLVILASAGFIAVLVVTSRQPKILTKLLAIPPAALGFLGLYLMGRHVTLRFGCFLLIGGAASYFGNLIIKHQIDGTANLLGGLAAILGIVLVAFANGWIGHELREDLLPDERYPKDSM
jgi:hypothetical protein